MADSSIERWFRVLEALSDDRLGLSLGDIAAKADIPKSATHRMLNLMCKTGYVAQLPSRNYRLTLKLPSLGFRFLSNTRIVSECQYVLDQLADTVGELVRLSMVNNESLVWIAKAQGAKNSLVIDPVMGKEVALHATATGKVWLASLSTEDALRLVLRHGFGTPAQHGPNVIQSVEALQAELARTRSRGYGLALEEADPGIVAIAVAIPSNKRPEIKIATLSIAGPSSRLSEEKLIGMLPKLRGAAEQLGGIDVFAEFTNAAF